MVREPTDLPLTQCAAVSTHLGAMSVPPQLCLPFTSMSTIQGHLPGVASLPPTILVWPILRMPHLPLIAGSTVPAVHGVVVGGRVGLGVVGMIEAHDPWTTLTSSMAMSERKPLPTVPSNVIMVGLLKVV